MLKKYIETIKGFSLIEVIFAFLILSIGLSALFALFSPALKMGIESRQMSRLAFFAQEKLEDIKTENITALNNLSTTGSDFVWNILAEPAELNNNVSLYRVQLAIERQDVAQKNITEEFITYRIE